MNTRLISVAVAAVMVAWAPLGLAREIVALPYNFTVGDLVSVNMHSTGSPTFRPSVSLRNSLGTTIAAEDGTRDRSLRIGTWPFRRSSCCKKSQC